MLPFRLFIRTMILLLGAAPCLAVAQAPLETMLRERGLHTAADGFIENKGQIVDQNGKPHEDLRFLFNGRGVNVQLRSNAFSYEFRSTLPRNSRQPSHSDPASFLRTQTGAQVEQIEGADTSAGQRVHRVDVEFEGAAANPRIVAEYASAGVLNYNLAHLPPDGVNGVRCFASVTYKDLYPFIDVRFFIKRMPDSDEIGLGYDFIIHPGGDAAAIRLRYRGHDSLVLTRDERLRIVSSCGNVEENIPRSYLLRDANDVEPLTDQFRELLHVTYRMEGDLVSYHVPSYDAGMTCVIDPWGTYYGGGSVTDICRGVDVDGEDNILVSGYTSSSDAIATTGAHQTTIGGSVDAFVVKFDSTGVRKWATYFGGTGTDLAEDIAVDAAGNCAVTGFTNSTAGIATPGAFMTTLGATASKAFLARFDTAGHLLWGTYFGGSDGGESGTGIAIDAAGNIFITGSSNSTAGLATPGAYQSFRNSYRDLFLARFSSSGDRIWATYFGGNSTNADCETEAKIAADPGGAIGLCTYSASTSGLATPGAFKTTPFGRDAVVALFTPDGMCSWATYYGGHTTGIDDRAWNIAFDRVGSLVFVGTTNSLEGIATPGAFKLFGSGFHDGFIAKFTNTGARVWGTYYGGSGYDFMHGVTVDAANNIIIAGGTTSPDSIATPCAFQQNLRGSKDIFIAEFDPAGQELWSSYYGGSDPEEAIEVATDQVNNIVFVGFTYSGDGIATPGAHQPMLGNAGGRDGFVVKMPGSPCPEGPMIITGPVTGSFCAGDSITVPYTCIGEFQAGNIFTAQLSDSARSFDQPVAIGSVPGVSSGSIRCRIPASTVTGRYRVRVVSSLPPVDGIDNGLAINIFQIPPAWITGPSHVCAGDSAVLEANKGSGLLYQWKQEDVVIPGAEGPSFTAHVSGTYSVRVTNAGGCAAESNPLHVIFDPPLYVDAGPDKVLCQGDSARLGNPARGGTAPYSYVWTPAAGLSSPDSARPLATPVTTTEYIVTVMDSLGCAIRDSVLVVVNEAPSLWMPDTVLMCRGGGVDIGAEASGGTPPFSYRWLPAYGLSRQDVAQPHASPDSSTRYTVAVTDAAGCVYRVSVLVRVLPVPVLSLGPASILCEGSSQIISLSRRGGTPPYTVRCTPASAATLVDSARILVQPASSTTIVVIVTDARGCTAVDSVFVRVIPKPVLPVNALGPVRFCEGDSVLLTARNGVVVKWSTSEVASSIVARAPGLYWYSVSDSMGCVWQSDTMRVLVDPNPQARIIGPSRVCRNSVLKYSSANSGFRSYLWDAEGGTILSGSGTSSVTVQWGSDTSGMLHLTETVDSSRCRAATAMQVSILTELQPFISGPRAGCAGDTVILDGGDGYAEYEWRDSSGVTLARTQRLGVTRRGTYTLAVKDATGCGGTQDAYVEIHTGPVLTLQGAVSFCERDSLRLDAGGGFSDYRWTDEGGVELARDRYCVRRSAGRIVVTVTDSNGCRASASVDVTMLPVPLPVLVGPTQFCEGDTVTIGVERDYPFIEWQHDGVPIGTGRNLRIAAGGSYAAVVRDSNGCGATAQVRIVMLERPSAAVLGQRSACEGSTLLYRSARSDSGVVHEWRVDGGSIVGPADSAVLRVRWESSGRGRIVLTLRRGACSSADSVDVFVSSSLQPRITASGPPVFCAGDSVSLDAGFGYAAYEWRRNDTLVATIQHVVAAATGRYTVRVVDDGGCSGSDTLSVLVRGLPLPSITGPSSMCEGDSVDLDAGAFAAYQWRDGGGVLLGTARILRVRAAGIYSVRVLDAAGCAGSSAPHAVVVNPRPDAPMITAFGDTLVSTAAFRYQWYQGDTLIQGATDRMHRAVREGWYTVRIWNSHGCEALSPPFEYTRRFTALATVQLPDLSAAPGERVRVPVVLSFAQQLDAAGAAAFTASIRFDKNLLLPIDGTPHGVLDGRDRVITLHAPFSGAGSPSSPPDTLASLSFMAMLGDTDRTALHLEFFDFDGAPVRVTRYDGSFVLRICREGGDRLFDYSGRVQLLQNRPNPFNSTTVIDFETIEQGPTSLVVLDLLGRRVATLADGVLAGGRHHVIFEASALPSGLYLMALHTPSTVLMRTLTVVK